MAFYTIKKALVTAPIIQPPDWNLPFKIMCDASDYVVGAVLGQCRDKQHYAISYASKTLTGRPTQLRHNGEGTFGRGLCHGQVQILLGWC